MNRERQKAKPYILLGLFFLLLCTGFGIGWQRLFVLFGFSADRGQGCTVSFINVGKADSALIACDGYHILIDAGEDASAENVCVYLERYGVRTLDLVIATHPDKDHIGGMAKIIENFQVKRFWQRTVADSVSPNTDCYTDMLDMLAYKEILSEEPSVNRKAVFGHGEITVLSPSREYGSTNDDSIVLRLDYGASSFLFTGDAQEEVEKDLIRQNSPLEADVLKVSHHGSKNATSNAFLQRVEPLYAVISVGDNTNNLPSSALLKRLEENGAEILRTDEGGTVTVQADLYGNYRILSGV